MRPSNPRRAGLRVDPGVTARASSPAERRERCSSEIRRVLGSDRPPCWQGRAPASRVAPRGVLQLADGKWADMGKHRVAGVHGRESCARRTPARRLRGWPRRLPRRTPLPPGRSIRRPSLRRRWGSLPDLVIEREVARRVVLGHDERIRSAVARLRLDGASWGQIGGALGISRQGARQRFDSTARATRRASEVRTGATTSRARSDVLRTTTTKSADEKEGSRWTSWRP